MLMSADHSSWPAPSFELEREAMAPSGQLLTARGELDAASVPKLREILGAAIEDGQTPVIVDLSEVSFIDSLSLATLVRAQSRLGGPPHMAVVAHHPYVLLIVEAGGLDAVLSIFENREQAEAYVSGADERPPPE
jgi:anti-anti-sigma factor